MALETITGEINSDLTVGVDVTTAVPLRANTGLASMGPALGGRGFVLLPAQARQLGGGNDTPWLKKLTTGKDITGRHRNRFVIDARDYASEADLRKALPQVYQRLKELVYPARASNNDPKLREFWWKFRRSNDVYFNATESLPRFIATVETTKHRNFVFVGSDELLEHGVIGFGFDDAWILGVLSSRHHICWALANGGTLEDRPRYNKDVCFDTFPFPLATTTSQESIRAIADELDAHRRHVLGQHPALTLTTLYNVLDKLRSGTAPSTLNAADRLVFDDGLLLVLRELHDRLDATVADAYGWPASLTDAEIIARLLDLNHQRAAEETRGVVHWLRPSYQVSRFGSTADRPKFELVGGGAPPEKTSGVKPRSPADDLGQTAAVIATLAAHAIALEPDALARTFRQGRACEAKVRSVLSALVRLGYVITSDAGRSYLLRRAA